ncbi:hypothetical protein [Nocardia brasiliensis]|uniref:hypothetical protein n=1 Tax=Nocardia brasiliensis TaxID=37326 RepID=UPI0024548032|nr:hypothetical protein [Nocardia brasiliensis]
MNETAFPRRENIYNCAVPRPPSVDEMASGIARHYHTVGDEAADLTRRKVAKDQDLGFEIKKFESDRSVAQSRANSDTARAGSASSATRVAYTKDEFAAYWKSRNNHSLTAEGYATLDRGCIGVTMLFLGKYAGSPPLHLSFRDFEAHHNQRRSERALTEGQIANTDIRRLRSHLAVERRRLAGLREQHQRYLDGDPAASDMSHHIDDCLARLQQGNQVLTRLRDKAREIWANMPKGFAREMLDMKLDAQLEGSIHTFDRVSGYTERLNVMLADNPSRAGFASMVESDLRLSQLKGLILPPGSPGDHRAEIISKKFWSGRRLVSYDNDGLRLSAAEIESKVDAQLFLNKLTGQVDMSTIDHERGPLTGDYDFFDYGYYNKDTQTWWHANHANYNDPSNPMLIYQSTSAEFFTDRVTEFDRSVISIVFRQSGG